MVRPSALVSGSVTRVSAATAVDVPRIICSQSESEGKSFRVVTENNPAFSFDFKPHEVAITHRSKFKNRNTELVEVERQSSSKLYQLYFRNFDEKGEFLSFYNY